MTRDEMIAATDAYFAEGFKLGILTAIDAVNEEPTHLPATNEAPRYDRYAREFRSGVVHRLRDLMNEDEGAGA